MKKSIKLALVAALIASATQSSFGQERGEMLERIFSRMDKNGDGVLEQSEAPAEFWSKLSNADSNKDGKIDKTEAAAGMKGMAGRRDRGPEDGKPGDRGPADGKDRAQGDRSPTIRPSDSTESEERFGQLIERFGKDGKVALADLPAQLRDRLAKLDSNDDKIIEKSELKGSAMADLLRDGAGAGATLDRIRKMMQTLDKDGDGKVAIADIPGDLKNRLAKLDKNGDGQLERSEMVDLKNILADGKSGEGKGAPEGAILERMQQMFKQLDKDGDGKIALADVPELTRDRLSKLDSNNDGLIEKSELKGLMDLKRDGKPGEEKKGEGRYGLGGDDTAPQAPKRPDSK